MLMVSLSFVMELKDVLLAILLLLPVILVKLDLLMIQLPTLVPLVKLTNGLTLPPKNALLFGPVPKLIKLMENVKPIVVMKLKMLKKLQELMENVSVLILMNSKPEKLMLLLKPKKLIDVKRKLLVSQLVKPTKPVKELPVNQKLPPPVLMPLPLKPDVTNVLKTELFGNVPLVLTPPPSN
eukprot:TRINITY_DN996_c0_g1_i6.p1 TRINITY_DN996_c0_g1~~TRINITY_DN996_c0_g1_i6.p1  ORF type:complete len:181 (+),score=17.23 TRINITY_DN996_c0_g1_i6:542-1084(+)